MEQENTQQNIKEETHPSASRLSESIEKQAAILEEGKISIFDLDKIEIRAGKILEASPIEGSSKLLKLSVDLGEKYPRQILSGIAKYFENPEELVGVICGFVTNLEPRKMMKMDSNGMILATSGENPDGTSFFSLLKFEANTPPGSKVR